MIFLFPTAFALTAVVSTPSTAIERASLSPAQHLRFDALHRLRSHSEGLGSTRWAARDIVGRVMRETATGAVGGATTTQWHRYDGWRRVATSEGTNEKRFLFGRALDELLVQESSGAQLAPLVSPLGSTMKLVNGAGCLADQFRYDAFGEPLTGDTKAFSHLFAGAIYDAKAKLYDLRHRHYDPQIGRFLSRDPLGMHADGFNTGNGYAYVGDNPLTRRDPLGLVSGDGILGWLQEKAGQLERKAWDVAWGIKDGGDFFVGAIGESLQEAQRTFDDFMCAGLPGEAQSQIGKRIAANEKEGDSLPEAIAGAAFETAVETVENLATTASSFGSAVSEGNLRKASAIATGAGLAIVTPGPDEIVVVKALEAASKTRSLTRAGERLAEGPGEAKCNIDGSETPSGVPSEGPARRWRDDDSRTTSSGGGSGHPPMDPPSGYGGEDFGSLPEMIQRLLDEGPSAVTGIPMVDACELWLSLKSIRSEIGGLYGPFSYAEMYTFVQAIERFNQRRGPFGPGPGVGGVQ